MPTPTKFFACPRCRRAMDGRECSKKTVNVDGKLHDRVAYPPNYDWMPAAEFPEQCRDCDTPKGGIHHEFCCMEECPLGDGQLLSCEHGPHA